MVTTPCLSDLLLMDIWVVLLASVNKAYINVLAEVFL